MLTLIVSNHADLNLLLIAKILMIMHLASQESISSSLHSLIEQEVTRPTTDSNFLDGPAQQLVAHHTLSFHLSLHMQHEIVSSHRLSQFTHYATATLHAVNHLLREEIHILKLQSLSYFKVHAIAGIIQIGMHRHDTDAFLNSFPHRALHIGGIANLLQSTKQQRMMTHYQVTTFTFSLIDDFFRHVQTQ